MRYFIVDNIKEASNSFVAACATEEQIDELYDACGGCMISETDQATYDLYEGE